jgi:predicted ABC-type ATPase
MQPFLLMVAGPNGSGKTTLTTTLRQSGVNLGVYINPDDIAAELTGDYDTRVLAAQEIADKTRDRCLDEKVSFSFETVMSHPSKVEILKQAKARNFLVIVYFVSTSDPNINVARVAQRVASGGHNVPEDRIIARYARTMARLPDAVAVADRTYLFDNSDLINEYRYAGLRWVASFAKNDEILTVKLKNSAPKWARDCIGDVSRDYRSGAGSSQDEGMLAD